LVTADSHESVCSHRFCSLMSHTSKQLLYGERGCGHLGDVLGMMEPGPGSPRYPWQCIAPTLPLAQDVAGGGPTSPRPCPRAQGGTGICTWAHAHMHKHMQKHMPPRSPSPSFGSCSARRQMCSVRVAGSGGLLPGTRTSRMLLGILEVRPFEKRRKKKKKVGRLAGRGPARQCGWRGKNPPQKLGAHQIHSTQRDQTGPLQFNLCR